MSLNGTDFESAIIAIVNNPEGELIPLNMFESRIQKGNSAVIKEWLVKKGLLEPVRVSKCGAVKNEIVVAWTRKGIDMKKMHTDEIRKELTRLNSEV